MAQIFSLAQRTAVFTSTTTAMYEVRSASANRPSIMEHGYTQNTGTATTVGIGRAAVQGVTPTNVLFLGEDPADTGLTNGAIAWSTSATIPANFLRRVSTPATVGAGFIFTYPRGLVMAVSSSIVFWNIQTGIAADVYTVVQE